MYYCSYYYCYTVITINMEQYVFNKKFLYTVVTVRIAWFVMKIVLRNRLLVSNGIIAGLLFL